MRLGTRRLPGLLLALALVLAVLALALGGALAAGASGPPDPYATPDPNPQTPVAGLHAAATGPGAVVFPNGTNTSDPSCALLLVPRINAERRVILCADVFRPPAGGPLKLLEFYTIDGVILTIDLDATYGLGEADCFGSSVPIRSDFTGTAKVIVRCKDPTSSDGNLRADFAVDSGIPVSEVLP